jgi:glycosyltransferase involved in cell wall biosynthesis
MKVLFLPSWYPSESKPLSGIFFKKQYELLLENNTDVKVAVFEIEHLSKRVFFKRKLRQMPEVVLLNEGDTIIIKLFSYSKNINHLKDRLSNVSLKIIKLLNDLNWTPDIIHVNDIFYSGYLANSIKNHLGVEYVITQHNPLSSIDISSKRDMNYLIEIIQNCKCISFVSHIENVLWIRSGYAHKLNVIGNFIDDSLFRPKKRESKDKLRIISVTATSFIKNNKLLFKSIASLIGKVDFEAIVVVATFYKDGESIEDIQNLIEDFGLNNYVSVKCNVSQFTLQDFYQKSDVFISTSYYETFGVSLAEAISSGCFGISLMNGGVFEIIDENINGIIVTETEILNLNNLIEGVEFNDNLKNVCHYSISRKFGRDAFNDKLNKMKVCINLLPIIKQSKLSDSIIKYIAPHFNLDKTKKV